MLNIEPSTSNIERRRNLAYRASLAFIWIAAFAAALLATRWGIAASPDSARYVRAARQMIGLEARGETAPEGLAERAHYPPMYTATLAGASLVGRVDPLVTARWLHALLLAGNAVIAAELVRRSTGSRGGAIFAAAAAAFTHSSIYIHTIALSEPLFVTFSLAALSALAAHVRRPRWTMLSAAGLLGGAGVLTRYIGWSLVPAGMFAVLLLARRPVRRRLGEAVLFAALACAAPIAWSVRNALALGSATNREIAWHPITLTHVRDAARVAWHWLAWDEVVNPALTFAAVVLAGLVVLLPLLWARDRGDPRRMIVPATVTLFIAGFAGLLAVSISLVDFHTPVDRRILAPVYAAWLVLVGCLLAEANHRGGGVRAAAWGVAIGLLLWNGYRAAILAHEQWRDGSGFAHRMWRQSPILEQLAAQVPGDQWVYTNAPGAVYLVTGRTMVLTVPSKFSASSMRDNADYGRQLEQMRADLQARRAVLLLFDRYAGRRAYFPTERELRRGLGLHPVARRGDGVIYDYVPPTSSPPAAPSSSQRPASSPSSLPSPATAPAAAAAARASAAVGAARARQMAAPGMETLHRVDARHIARPGEFRSTGRTT